MSTSAEAMPCPTSVAIVDPSSIARFGCEALITHDGRFEVVGSYSSVMEFVAGREPASAPDVILLDPWNESGTAEQELASAAGSSPTFALLVFTDHLDLHLFALGAKLSVRGYLSKRETPAWLLLDTLSIIARTKCLVVASMIGQRLLKVSREDKLPATPSLRPRQAEVLDLLINGLSDEQISRRLGIAKTTVHSHVSSILSKYQASNRVQLGAYASRATQLYQAD